MRLHSHVQPNDLPFTCESLPLCGFQELYVGNEQVLLAPSCLMGFPFTSSSSMGLHVSTPLVFYPPWEPRTSLLSNTIGNNTPLLSLFQDRLCGLYGLAWCNILFPLQLLKGPALHHLRKGFKYTHPVPAPIAKETSITLPPLPHTTMGYDSTCWCRAKVTRLSRFLSQIE